MVSSLLISSEKKIDTHHVPSDRRQEQYFLNHPLIDHKITHKKNSIQISFLYKSISNGDTPQIELNIINFKKPLRRNNMLLKLNIFI
jgi:hypothetical protein